MPQALDKLTIEGFKSIRSLVDFELKNLNILIGANGAGKSNFIDFFRMLRAMMELSLPELGSSSLTSYVGDGGGSDDFLFNGPKITSRIKAEMRFGENGYRFNLSATSDETFLVNDEETCCAARESSWVGIGSGNSSPQLLKERKKKTSAGEGSVAASVYESIASWKVYHFHDSSKVAPIRRFETVDDCEYLRFDGSNLAPFLLNLKENEAATYGKIVETIQLVSPFFEDFVLRPNKQDKVRLLWRQKGSDYPLKPYHLSDGTLRFVALATALLQPHPPSTMIIDEPELGLHPYAIEILAELIRATSEETQLIISTQSPALVDYFEPAEMVVVNREEGATTLRRVDEEDLSVWLEDYSLGDLWRKNIVPGGPVHE